MINPKLTRRQLGTIDLQTGEVLDGIPIFFGAKVQWREEFFMQIQEKLETIAKDKELSGRPRRVLDYMMSKLSWENWIHVQQKEIAEQLELNKADVSKAISLLIRKGIILKARIPDNKRLSAYKLNSYYGWKGKVKNLAGYRMQEEKHLRIINKENITEEELKQAEQSHLFNPDTYHPSEKKR